MTGIDAERTFVHRNDTYSAYELLHKKLNIVYLPERVVAKYATHVQQEISPVKTESARSDQAISGKGARSF